MNVTKDGNEERAKTLHKMDMKLRATYRASLHLSGNSMSYAYSSSNADNSGNGNEVTLPFIGPGLTEQYHELKTLLQRGFFGYEDDSERETMTESHSNQQPNKSNDRDTLKATEVRPNCKSNVSALLIGPRGHGKSMVLERCLTDLSTIASKRREHEIQIAQERNEQIHCVEEDMSHQEAFRVVRLNGLLYQGDNVVSCVREIARQIGEIAKNERNRKKRVIKHLEKEKYEKNGKKGRYRRQNRCRENLDCESLQKGPSFSSEQQASLPTIPDYLQTPQFEKQITNNDPTMDIKNKHSGFNSDIALLDEVLRTARIDGIPILIVIEDLDEFLTKRHFHMGHGGNFNDAPGMLDRGIQDRQIILYHILDRVANQNFLVSFVGMATDLSVINNFEKRIKSRLEGTSKIIYFGQQLNYRNIVESLLASFTVPLHARFDDAVFSDHYEESNAMLELRDEVEAILVGSESYDKYDDEVNDASIVRRVLERNYEIKSADMRWFCRVFDVALGLLASDIEKSKYSSSPSQNCDTLCNPVIQFTPSHVAIALNTMGASICDVVRSQHLGSSFERIILSRWGTLLGDPNHYSTLVGNDPRLRALLDLSGLQISVLLASRRILARDDSRVTAEDDIDNAMKKHATGSGTMIAMAAPLTYQRILDEYTTSFVGSGHYTSSDRYSSHLFFRAFLDLIELDLIRLKNDHSRIAPLLYDYSNSALLSKNIVNLPLYVNLEWESEFVGFLKAGILHCSTALRDWGLKQN